MLKLSALASGDEPVTWHWEHDGVPINESGSSVAISNVPASASGMWRVTASNSFGTTTSRPAVVRIASPQFPVLFRDDFETNSGEWQLQWGAANGIPDYSVNLSHNHRLDPTIINGLTELIPRAPNTREEGTRAGRLAVNNVVSWSCNGLAIASRSNTSVFRSGAIMFGLSDMFASIANPAKDSFVLIDNLRVEDLSGRTRILKADCFENSFNMLFSAIPGRRYEVFSSDNLTDWVMLASLESAAGPLHFRDSPVQERRFYRVAGPLP